MTRRGKDVHDQIALVLPRDVDAKVEEPPDHETPGPNQERAKGMPMKTVKWDECTMLSAGHTWNQGEVIKEFRDVQPGMTVISVCQGILVFTRVDRVTGERGIEGTVVRIDNEAESDLPLVLGDEVAIPWDRACHVDQDIAT